MSGTDPINGETMLVRATGLSCIRGQRLLWRGMDFALAPGGAIYLTGANGIGKSSLLRMIAGLLPAASGTIARPVRCALIDERLALESRLAVYDSLLFWARIDGASGQALTAAMEQCGIAHLRDVPVRFLSTGQRKRAALAAMLCADAPLWLLDEPANGLDRSAVTMLETVMARHRAGGGGIVYASHQTLAVEGAQQIDLAIHAPVEAIL
ncbi:MAG: heme ABC exporter ATP-binding protein CcmA [Sphingopyxis sp.]|nr:heme ABC exporter ATP-binding protein CcmA [Sphingopyxis sp.]